jgi:hypothetical protein
MWFRKLGEEKRVEVKKVKMDEACGWEIEMECGRGS